MLNYSINLKVLFMPSLLFACIFFSLASVALAEDRSCVSAKCHATISKDVFVHSPATDPSCTACHQATSDPEKKTKHPGNLTITLVQQGADLCYMCHEPKNKKKVVHAPIQGGACTSCHDPHHSPNKGMLKAPVPKLCFQCHPDSIINQPVTHPPVKSGDCSGCHDNHESDFPGRLVQEGNALCFMCHADKDEALKTKKSVHAPAKQACLLCHFQHGSKNPKLLKASLVSLCSNCHPNETGLMKKAITKHAPMTDANSCMNCHDIHYSDNEKLSILPGRELCLKCHDFELDTESGKIKNLKAFLDANQGGQGPLKGKPCETCHNPHGSDYMRLLVKFYVPTFYTSYSDGKYALCFRCHEKSAFTEMRTTTATGFRDGDKNLHYLHVNIMRKGRTCRACHEACAECQSEGLPKQIKTTVDFGGWKMPMNFSLNAKGGSCAPGCHAEKMYSR